MVAFQLLMEGWDREKGRKGRGLALGTFGHLLQKFLRNWMLLVDAR